MSKTIEASVGSRGVNNDEDVRIIQQLLNAIPVSAGGPATKLNVEGKAGQKTIAAIQAFQLFHFGWSIADGRVDPDGKTLAQLNAFEGTQETIDPPVIKQGARGRVVEELQKKLQSISLYAGDIDGDFGPKTRDAVLQFQKLTTPEDVDAIVGPKTWTALAAARPLPSPKVIPDQMWSAVDKLYDMVAKTAQVPVGVGLGLRTVGGAPTDQLALIVSLPQDASPELSGLEESIPPEFEGLPVEVQRRTAPVLTAGGWVDDQPHATMVGGMQIGPPPGVLGTSEPGTLGAIVRRRSDGAAVLLTCAHVVSNRDQVSADFLKSGFGNDAFQPAKGGLGSRVVGTVAAVDNITDCAIIEPTGVQVKNEIQEIGAIKGSTACLPYQLVRKRGARTGLTLGFVVSVEKHPSSSNWREDGPTPSVRAPHEVRLIKILSCQPTFYSWPPIAPFADKGDSGSALVDVDNRIVGMLFAIEGLDQKYIGWGMSIEVIETALDVEVP